MRSSSRRCWRTLCCFEIEPDELGSVCHQALALWRGQAFGEFASEEPFRLEAIRLSRVEAVRHGTQARK